MVSWAGRRRARARVCLQRDSSRGGIDEGIGKVNGRGATHLRQRAQRAPQSPGLDFHLGGWRLTQGGVGPPPPAPAGPRTVGALSSLAVPSQPRIIFK